MSTEPTNRAQRRIIITEDDLAALSPDGDRSADLQTASLPSNGLPRLSMEAGATPLDLRPGVLRSPLGQLLVKLGANTVIAGVVSGAIGGFLGFLFAENIYNPNRIFATTSAGLDVKTALWVLIVGLLLGFVLMGWEGLTAGSPVRLFRDGGIGAGVGAVAGFVGGYVAQWIYTKMLGSDFQSNGKLILARMIGWAIFGGIIGVGIGIPSGGRKVINGLVGGLAGGAAGGLVFQLLGDASTGSGGAVLRMFGLVVTGLGIGVGIGLVERIRRDSWLVFTGGPMTGKEFILYQDQTKIGRDYRCEIVMAKDAGVAPFHATFVRDAAGQLSVVANQGVFVSINGVASPGGRLRSNDVIGIGSSLLRLQERAPSRR